MNKKTSYCKNWKRTLERIWRLYVWPNNGP